MIALLITTALATECEPITMSDILAVEAPAVIVLGERHGFKPDLGRAGRIVFRLSQRGPVRVGLEAVHHDQQSILDQYADGKMDPSDIPELMNWDKMWGYPFKAYEPLVTAAVLGAEVRGAGLDLEQRPKDQAIPLPSSYIEILRDAMAGHDLPLEMEQRFVESMAWRDHQIASHSLKDWNGEGYAVIVTGRGHVEGGKGVQWQAQRMTDAPVHSFVLAWADPPCYPGDRVWRPSLWEKLGLQ